jgi:predicted GIY-YIG superfamily endonuclease
MEKQPCVYIMSNNINGTLYVGVTNNLIARVYQHKHLDIDGFAKKYNCKYLVYYEQFNDMITAISREKQLKSGSRKKKIELIEKTNCEWKDLYNSLI